MIKSKSILALVVLATWFACTVRCQALKVEQLSGERTSFSAVLNSDAPADSNQNDACSWPGCAGYEPGDSLLVLTVPEIGMPLSRPENPARIGHGKDEFALLELSRSWQFALRSALPARAPSLNS